MTIGMLYFWEDSPVFGFLSDTKTRWYIGKIPTLFLHKVVWNILAQNVRPTEKPDRLYWSLSNHGEYNVKSGYGQLMRADKIDHDIRFVKMWKVL